jgi:hypothetical protein
MLRQRPASFAVLCAAQSLLLGELRERAERARHVGVTREAAPLRGEREFIAMKRAR